MSDQQILAPQTPINALTPANRRPFAAIENFARQPAVLRALPTLAMTGAVGIAALAWFVLQAAPQTPLYAGLAEADKAAVAEALQSSGIGFTLDAATGTLSVDADRLHEARMLLAGQGLPKALPTGDSLIASLPMGSSRAVEGETLRAAREADLARTIEAIDAVKTARVHLAMAEPSVFVRENKPAAASVMLTLQDGRSLSDAQVQAIRHLVASSVPGLAAAEVSVIDQSGALLSSQQGVNSENRTFQLQMQMEERYRQALVALLAPMVGQGNFSVEVHADVDMTESQATRETYPENDSAIRSEEGNKSSSTNSAPEAVGIPGALSNQPPAAAQIATTPGNAQQVPGPGGSETAENFARTFDNGREISVTHQPQGRLNRVSVAVALDHTKGTKALSAAELATIENLVKGAVGFNAERGDVVAISQRRFVESKAVDVPWWDQPWFWPLVRQGGALLAAILAFLLIGRPIMKAIKSRAESRAADDAALEAQLLAVAPNSSAEDGAPPSGTVTLDMIEAAPSYEARAKLVRDFVRQDSARAAQVVRQLMLDKANG